MATKKNVPDAAEAYAARQNEIAHLMDLLTQELKVVDARRAKQRPGGWGYVGDLAYVREGLINLLAFMSGVDPAGIRESLGIDDE